LNQAELIPICSWYGQLLAQPLKQQNKYPFYAVIKLAIIAIATFSLILYALVLCWGKRLFTPAIQKVIAGVNLKSKNLDHPY